MIDFTQLTEQAAKNSAAAELGVPASECTFDYDSDYKGSYLRAYHVVEGYSSRYYFH